MSTTTWDALKTRLDGLKKPTTVFTICEDPDARQRLHTAKVALHDAEEILATRAEGDETGRTSAEARVRDAKSAATAAQKAFDKVAVRLTFQALERKALEELQKQHPALEEDEAAGDDFHMETFAPALIAAASVDGMPLEYARHCLDTWAPGDARGLWLAAWTVQQTQRTDLGKG